MTPPAWLTASASLSPALLLALATIVAGSTGSLRFAWTGLHVLSGLALVAALASLGFHLAAGADAASTVIAGLAVTLPGAWVAVLVQFLGTVIGAFSMRYLEGEPGQRRYVTALAGVLASVHVLLLADHWLVLIGAWSATGIALRHLLCFHRDRPFALLAAHKKQIADRAADVVLLAAAALAWAHAGTGSISGFLAQMAQGPTSIALQASAVLLVLAVILRTALLPVHGWLIQVMEAPTPVSALLHAGVVNLGGFVLIRFAPLLEGAPIARWLLVAFGLGTAALAGLVMLTRVSIKVRLAWSTVAQMGFMLLECGLGLYTLALLHLIGHSLYKAQHFLTASSVVRQTRLRAMEAPATPSAASLLWAPAIAGAIVVAVESVLQTLTGTSMRWPGWWTAVLALAWAPLLWLPSAKLDGRAGRVRGVVTGTTLLAGLTALAALAHVLPFGVHDAPDLPGGLVAVTGMAILYGMLAVLQWRPQALSAWRRWSYAGFYVDEFFTRLAIRLWPADRVLPVEPAAHRPQVGPAPLPASK